MKNILFVVHRYAPFPGGSENHVRDMAEECLSRGNNVAVFTGEHKGDLNGVHVTSDANILLKNWDLIVVHGGDVGVQNFVLNNIDKIPSKVLFVIIKPSDSEVYNNAIKKCYKIGCCTKEDWEYVTRKNVLNKSVKITYAIDEKRSVGLPGFKEKYGIKTDLMFVSSGGFWPNKAMHELVEVFNRLQRKDITLVLTGYDNRHNLIPKESEFVKPLMIDDRNDVMSAIKECDLYVMHSHSEGFGLVLLESMLNKTPWAARNIAGARLMSDYGFAYNNDDELLNYMENFKSIKGTMKVDNAYEYVIHNHLIRHTVDDIMRAI
jgi:glycosyltransferase involved in cell wall biosynthesis